MAYQHYIKDVLYYLSPDSGASIEKAKGVVIGVLSTLCYTEGAYLLAVKEFVKHMPDDFRRESIPEPWLQDVLIERLKYLGSQVEQLC